MATVPSAILDSLILNISDHPRWAAVLNKSHDLHNFWHDTKENSAFLNQLYKVSSIILIINSMIPNIEAII